MIHNACLLVPLLWRDNVTNIYKILPLFQLYFYQMGMQTSLGKMTFHLPTSYGT